MSVPASADRPPAAVPPTPPGAPVRHPVAPAPPRSRLGAHLVSVLAGLVLTPFGLAVLGAGAYASAAAAAAGDEPSAVAVTALVGGAVVLGLVAATAAASGLGPLVGGVVFGLAPGLAFVLNPASLTTTTTSLLEPAEPLAPESVRLGIAELGRTGQMLLLGLTLVLIGLAGHLARRGGKRAERIEAHLAAAQRPPDVPTPPRTRRAAHLTGIALGLLATPVALALVAGSVGQFVAADGDQERSLATVLISPAAIGAVVLAGVVLAAGWSSFGLIAGGVVWGLVPGVIGILEPTAEGGVEAVLAWFGRLAGPAAQDGLEALTTGGGLLAWGAIAVFGGLGVHAARRDGTRRERAELAVQRASH